MIEVRNIEAGYGDVKILYGISFEVPEGGLTALLGGNGSGKSTTLKALAGLVAPSSGEIWLSGRRIDKLPAHMMTARGLVLVPQGKEVFAAMSVEENILMGAYHRRHQRAQIRRDLDDVYAQFPRLQVRKHAMAGLLSGGERQMLALGRALIAKPRMLLLDEPSASLSPRVVGEITEIIRGLHKSGLSILLVEQNVSMALELADELHILREGRIAYSCRNGPDVDMASLQEFYLGGAPVHEKI
jgi:branched-chain amino acid transport system ATP-binding protein